MMLHIHIFYNLVFIQSLLKIYLLIVSITIPLMFSIFHQKYQVMNVKQIMHSKSIMSSESTSSTKIFFHIVDYPLMLKLETYSN